MKRLALLLAAATALALSACGRSEPEVEARNASVEEVAEQVREASGADSFIRPGRWVSTVQFDELVAPGMPPGAAEQMKQMMGEGRSYESCLTEAEASRPKEDFFTGRSEQCRYDHFTMGGGKIDARMRCAQGGATQVMAMQGTYSPETYQMVMRTSLEGAPEPAGGMTMRMRVEARRVGECRPSQE